MGGGMFAGMLEGFTKSSSAHTRELMEIELAAREGIAKMWESIASNESSPPDIRQAAMQNIMEIRTADPNKPLNKKLSNIDAVARLNPIAPQEKMTGEALPRGPEPGTPPQGLLSAPYGVGAPGGQPMGPPDPAPQGPPAELPTPEASRDSLFYSQDQMTATKMNEIQKLLRMGLRPPGYGRADEVFPLPAGGAVGVRDFEGNIETVLGPPKAPTGAPGIESKEAYVQRAMEIFTQKNKRPPNLSEQQEIVEVANENYPRDPAGMFFPLVDPFGAITEFYNPQRESSIPPPPGESRRAAVPFAERKQQSALEVMLEDVDRLSWYADKNRQAIGPVAGRGFSVARQFMDVGEDVNRMFRISDNLAELLLRARSGAQINESEYTRLRGLMPDPRGPEGKFFSDLKEYQLESKRIFEKQFGRSYTSLEYIENDDGTVTFYRQNPDGTMTPIE